MADTKISALTALTGANLASTDEFVVLDKSDTTMSADGTDKRMTAQEAATGLRGFMGPQLVDLDLATRTSGDFTLNSTSWANLDTGLDLTLNAASGDIAEVGISALWGSAASVNGYLDVATIVSGSPVNYIGGDGDATDRGIVAWDGDMNASGAPALAIGGSVMKTLVSGDISTGTVTLRLRYRTSVATNKVLFANTDIRFHWWAKVWRP